MLQVGALYETPVLVTKQINISAIACSGPESQSPLMSGSFWPLVAYPCTQDQLVVVETEGFVEVRACLLPRPRTVHRCGKTDGGPRPIFGGS